MRNNIHQKLKTELLNENLDEAKVIYILSCIRKIIEINKQEKKYKVLKFYCDWALHSQIDNTQTIREMLEIFLVTI